jgi:hypothetical protein
VTIIITWIIPYAFSMDDPDSCHDRNMACTQISHDDQASPSSDSAQFLSCGEHCTLFMQ